MTNQKTPEQGGATREQIEHLEAKVADTLAYYQCRETNPKADHPRMGYHAFPDDQREHLRAQKREAAAEIVRMMISRPSDQHRAWEQGVKDAVSAISDSMGTLTYVAPHNPFPALSVSASAHPAGEEREAEEREAESEDCKSCDGTGLRDDLPIHGQCHDCWGTGYVPPQPESEDHAATVTGDREKLIAEAYETGTFEAGSDYDSALYWAGLATRLADALAAPVEADEAKLREVVRDALPREVQSWGADEKPEWRYRGEVDVKNHLDAIVPALMSHLRGDGR